MLSLNKNENAILTALSKHHHMTMKQLHSHIQTEHNISLSVSQVYNLIKKMREAYILIKEWSSITLNKLRVQQLKWFTERIVDLHEHYSQQHGYLWVQESEVHYTSTIRELDNLWADKVGKLLQFHTCDHYYSYESHTYFLLGMFDIESTIYKKFFTLHQKIFWVIWNDTFLDRYWVSLESATYKEIKIDTRIWLPKSWYVLTVVWDYLIEFHFDPIVTQYFEQIFEQVASLDTYNPDIFSSVFDMKGKHRFLITHDPKRSTMYKKLIERSYGKH